MQSPKKLAEIAIGLLIVTFFFIGLIFILPRLLQGIRSTSIPLDTPSNIQNQENVIITFAVYAAEQDFYKPLIADFQQQNPSITVQSVILDSSIDSFDWHSLASSADTTILPGQTAISRGAGSFFRDLQPLMDADRAFDSEDFWPGLLTSCQDMDGHAIGVPTGARPWGVFFDEKAFDEAGLPHPAPGWTWNEFRQDIAKLAVKQEKTIRYGLADESRLPVSILAPLVYENLVKNGNDISSEAIAGELQWYIDLSKAGAIYPIRQTQDWQQELDQWNALFQQNAPAMWVGELDSLLPGGSLGEAVNNSLSGYAVAEAGFAPYPINNSQDMTTPIGSSCAAMSSGTAHSQAAWAWLNFLSRQWTHAGVSGAFGEIPARRSVADSDSFWKLFPAKAEPAVRFALDHAWYDYRYPQAYRLINDALIKVLTEGTDIGIALGEAQMSLSTQLDSTQPIGDVGVATPIPTSNAALEITKVNYSANFADVSDANVIESLSEEFNRLHPDIVINLFPINDSPPPTQDWYTYLAEKTDCFTWLNTGLWDDQTTNNLLNLTPFIETEGSTFIQDYYPSQLDAYRYQGDLYGIPAASQPIVMSYNADLIAQSGLEPPTIDWTFDDFIRLASDISSGSNEQDKTYGYFFLVSDPLFFSGRGTVGFDFDVDPLMVELDSLEMLNTLNWIVSLNQAGVLLPYGEDIWESNNQLLLSGKVAFWTSLAGQPEGWYTFGKEPSYRIGVVPLPKIPSAEAFGYLGPSRGHFISRQSANPQACWAWIKFLSEQQATLTGVPARRSVAESPAWESIVGKENAIVFRQALERMSQTHGQSNVRYYQIGWPLEQWRQQAVTAAILGGDSKQLLTDAQRKAEAYLACLSNVNLDEMNSKEIEEKVNICVQQADLQ